MFEAWQVTLSPSKSGALVTATVAGTIPIAAAILVSWHRNDKESVAGLQIGIWRCMDISLYHKHQM